MEDVFKKTVIVTLFTLLFTHFFGALSIERNYLLLVPLLPSVVYGIVNKTLFGKYIFLMFIGLFFNIISSYYFRDQRVMDSLFLMIPYSFICVYFFLRKIDVNEFVGERIILGLSVLFCICYIIQYSIYPKEIFHGAADRAEFDADVRIRMYGQGFSSLGVFLGINKLIVKKNLAYLLLVLLCIIVILLMGFRTMAVMLVLSSFVLISRLIGFNIKLIAIVIISAGVLYIISQIPLFSSVIDLMITRSETENFGNKDYVRVLQFNYFTQNHFINYVEYFFGSGLPAFGSGEYGKYMLSLWRAGLTYVDLGLLSLSWMIGVIPVVAMLLYSIKAITIKVDKKYLYIGTWFMYLLSISFTTFEFPRFGNFVVQAFCLYMVEKVAITAKTTVS